VKSIRGEPIGVNRAGEMRWEGVIGGGGEMRVIVEELSVDATPGDLWASQLGLYDGAGLPFDNWP
jgi:hypothetical protein